MRLFAVRRVRIRDRGRIRARWRTDRTLTERTALPTPTSSCAGLTRASPRLPAIVGWVERLVRETHYPCRELRWVSLRSTHPTSCPVCPSRGHRDFQCY